LRSPSRADCEGGRVHDEDDARIRGRRDHACDRRPDDEGHAAREPEQRVRLLEPRRADRRRHDSGRRRLEEGLSGSVDRDQDREVPELGGAGEQQQGDRRLDDPADDVGDEHDQLPRQAVGPDSADEHKEDERENVRGEHDTEGGRGAVERADDGERERDRDEAVPERRGCLSEPEQAELTLAKRTEELRPAHGRDST
jgi:hypothetical protein